jgi:signal transduction histidine kinase
MAIYYFFVALLAVRFIGGVPKCHMTSSENMLKEKLQSLLSKETSDYREIFKLTRELSKLDKKFQHFFVDAKTLIHLGRDSIKDHTTALIELVKNSYDADASNVQVGIFCKNGSDQIRVADNGFGMTKNDLINGWLHIGFSGKRISKQSKSGRRKTGEKGIGRISADRLGGRLELITLSESDGIIGLKVNWDEFDVENKDISDINVELFYPKEINIPKREGKQATSGTEIIISMLRQKWSVANIENLYYELSALTPPFNEVKDFQVELANDVAPAFSKKVNSEFFRACEIELTAVYDGESSDILYTIKDKYTNKEEVQCIKWNQLLSKVYKTEPQDVSEYLKCGPVTIKLLFFLREASSVQGTEFKISELREFLDNNAGIKIYRDNIAVKPYGFPHSQFGYDWLELAERKVKDPAGIGRGADSYSITPNQLIGAVFISRDSNIDLSDSAAREGLVESESFYDLRNLVLGSINMLETHRSNIYPLIEKSKEAKKSTSSKEAVQIQTQLFSVREELESIKTEIEKKSTEVEPSNLARPIEKSIEKVEVITKSVDKTITDLLNWNRVLSGLATIGISSAVFGHETEGSISLFTNATDNARMLINTTPPDLNTAISELDKAIKHSRKVASWGAYALTRVQREKRSKKNINIKRTIDAVVKELKPAFEASSIILESSGEMIVSKTYQMDIESILINLLTNAYTACNLKPGVRRVLVKVFREDLNSKKGYFFSVADTGPGIAPEFKNRIFEPLFSTKTISSGGSKSVGTGLGLTIVKSIINDLDGSIVIDNDPDLRGARFKVWLPKEK